MRVGKCGKRASLGVEPSAEFLCPLQVAGFGNTGRAVRGAAAAGEADPPVMQADVLYQREPVVAHRLFKGPEQVVRRGEQQRAVLLRVGLIPAKGWGRYEAARQ